MENLKTIQFQVEKAEEGGYVASGIGIAIVTDGDTLDKLLYNIQEAVELYFEDEDMVGAPPKPSLMLNFEALAHA